MSCAPPDHEHCSNISHRGYYRVHNMCRFAHILRRRMATDISVRDSSERSFAQQARECRYDPASGRLLSVALQVIGKPATAGDATNGYIAPATLAGCVSQAKAKGWSYVPLLFLSSFHMLIGSRAGVMTWEYPDAAASWISTVRAQSWPV